jgi:hypothetical protein
VVQWYWMDRKITKNNKRLNEGEINKMAKVMLNEKNGEIYIFISQKKIWKRQLKKSNLIQ